MQEMPPRKYRSSAISSHHPIVPPPLSKGQLESLQCSLPRHLTRLISHKYLKSTRNGYFQFGTLYSYIGEENAALKRMSDTTEHSYQYEIRQRSGRLDEISAENIQVTNALANGNLSNLTLIYSANDYCSCFMNGEFNIQRAKKFRDNGNPDVNSFVTYKSEMLINALRLELHRSRELTDLDLAWSPIRYGEKDHSVSVENATKISQRESLGIWSRIAFHKPNSFRYEDEFRLMLICRDKLGQLPEKSAPLNICTSSPLIAECIEGSGIF